MSDMEARVCLCEVVQVITVSNKRSVPHKTNETSRCTRDVCLPEGPGRRGDPHSLSRWSQQASIHQLFVEQLHSRVAFWSIRGGPPGGGSDLRNKKEDMLCKAKMILKREQDRAGKTIHDCQQSLVRLQDDMNDKIRETEKKLASTEKAKADALAQLATKKTEEPAPSAGGPGNSWQRGTDNPHDFIFWRICMSFTIHFPRSQYISLFLSLSLSLSWSLGPHVCYHRSARARCLRLSFCLLPPHSPVPCTGMPPPPPPTISCASSLPTALCSRVAAGHPGKLPSERGGVTTHFNRAERAGFGIAQGARDRCATLTLR